ncbi:hypothetical protein GS493_04145 [Rhodococcus hoagii]|nr:hypothetical protein [Prescottella equi]
MIDKILRGWDAKGLVRYLMGKGNHNEHTMPTVIGAWQADPGALQPDRTGPGDFDFDPDSYNQLLEHINETAEAAGLPRRQPQQGEPGYTKHGYVWHCSLSLGPETGSCPSNSGPRSRATSWTAQEFRRSMIPAVVAGCCAPREVEGRQRPHPHRCGARSSRHRAPLPPEG